MKLREGAEFEEKLTHLRSLYEPYAVAIALNLSITLPPWIHPEKQKDNWQAGPWDRAIQARSLAGRVQQHGRSFLEELSAVSSQLSVTATERQTVFTIRVLRAED